MKHAARYLLDLVMDDNCLNLIPVKRKTVHNFGGTNQETQR